MDITILIGLLILGFVAGIASSMIGIGGGIIIVPALVFLFGFDQKTAQGTSLMMLALPVAAMGAFAYYKAGHLNINASILLALTFVAGGYLGGKLVNQFPQETVKKIFALFMIVMAMKYLFFDKKKTPTSTPTQHHTEQQQ